MIKSIFIGNSDFAIPTLEILQKHTQITSIITGVDKVVTQRETRIQEPLPKIFAQKHSLPVYQPTNLKDQDFLEDIKKQNPDMMVIISYGKILPKELFEIPKLGSFNLHASLLPKYRGASPIQETLLHNDTLTGITLQRINEKMDDGNIFGTKKLPLTPNILYPELRSSLSFLAGETLLEFLNFYIKYKILPTERKQEGIPSFCGKIQKKDGLIDFEKHDALTIFNKYRAFYLWPCIYINTAKGPLKLQKIEIDNLGLTNTPPGTIIQADKGGLIVQTKKGTLCLQQLQPQNKKSQNYTSFINGYNIKKGDLLC